MEQIQVQIVRSQPVKAVLTGIKNVSPSGIPRVDLADQKQLTPVERFNGVAHQLLARTVTVHLSGVDEGQAMFHTPAQSLCFTGALTAFFAQIPCALTDRRDLRSVRQMNRFHALSSCFASRRRRR